MQQLQSLVDGDILIYKVAFGTKPPDFLKMVEAADDFLDRIEGLFDTRPEIFLTGKNNFRYQVATIKGYKSNRTAPKPRYFQALRDYLVDFYHAEVSDGVEADDLIASRSNAHTVVVSTDKDFMQLGGTYVFNPTKNELKFISDYEGWFRFYEQMLIGDTADAIPGIDGIGKVKAPRLLADKTKEEMEQLVRELYVKQYNEDGPRAYEEIRTLLWLKRDLYANTKSI